MRKKDETLQDTLLDIARTIADNDGLDSVNIRSIAQKAGVAAGTVYNYFSNKDEILLTLTEEYWKQALSDLKAVITDGPFCRQLQEIFAFLQAQIRQSAGKLMNSLSNVETAGQARMASMQSILEMTLLQLMEQDANIRKDIWNDTFTKEQFAQFILMHMMMLLKTGAPDPDFLISIVKRIIY